MARVCSWASLYYLKMPLITLRWDILFPMQKQCYVVLSIIIKSAKISRTLTLVISIQPSNVSTAPNRALAPSCEVSQSHTIIHTVGLLWTSDQPLAETSTYTGQHNIYIQETNIQAPSGIRTRDPSIQATADLRLRPRSVWNRHGSHILEQNLKAVLIKHYHVLAHWKLQVHQINV
jgi:hypothetical protein